MDQHIIGLSEGDSKDFTTSIPKDYANSELAGQEANYQVSIKAVKYRELPELDDELAKTIGEYETLDALRDAVREQLRSQKESEARRETREAVLKAVTDQAKGEVHPVLVHEEVDAMVDETKRMLEQSRISFEQYLIMMQKSEEQHREEIEPQARERAKRDLVLDAVAAAENIAVTDEEIAGWLEFYASVGGRRLTPKTITPGQRANIVTRLRRDKALSLLVEIAGQNQSQEETEDAQTPGQPADAAEESDAGSSNVKVTPKAKKARATGKTEQTTSSAKSAASAQASDETPEAPQVSDETSEATQTEA
jgi:trigger factor